MPERFYCRVRRPRKPNRFNYNSFLHLTEHRALRTTGTFLLLAWLAVHAYDDIKSLIDRAPFGEQKANAATIADVPNRSCRVSVTDLEGIEHTAHVTADTLYEAVARGLKAIKSSAWAGEIPEGITTVTVCAAQPEVEHRVKIAAFKNWINRGGGTPTDKMASLRIREILGL